MKQKILVLVISLVAVTAAWAINHVFSVTAKVDFTKDRRIVGLARKGLEARGETMRLRPYLAKVGREAIKHRMDQLAREGKSKMRRDEEEKELEAWAPMLDLSAPTAVAVEK